MLVATISARPYLIVEVTELDADLLSIYKIPVFSANRELPAASRGDEGAI